MLSVVPRGLLQFLGIQSGGRNPQSLSELLSPTIDLRDHYFNTNAQITSTSVAAANGAANFALPNAWNPLDLLVGGQAQVPAGEWWVVTEANVRGALFTTATAGSFVLPPFLAHRPYATTGLTEIWPMSDGTGVSFNATINQSSTRSLLRPVLVPPSSVIEVYSQGHLAVVGNVTFSVTLRFCRLPN